MPDFSDPKYASYVQLCNELNLPREFEMTDMVLDASDQSIWSYCEWAQIKLIMDRLVWLPTLADWLEKLEETEFHHVSFFRRPDNNLIHADAYSALAGVQYTPQEPQGANGPTHEEAAGRLWIAVSEQALGPAGSRGEG